MASQLLDAFSTTNTEGDPYLHTCTLVTGDGTVRVDFKNGRAKVPADLAHLAAQHPHVEVPALEYADATPAPVDAPEAPEPAKKREVSEEDLAAAREHLEQEGEEVPDVEVAEPETTPGFEATTSEGADRCQAAKADGTQCANAAAEGQACRLGKHQEQLKA